MSKPAPVGGHCDPRFQPVRDAFADNFTAGSETGAAIAVTIGGERVIDLWGGWTNAAHDEPWEEDTIVCCYSVGKAVCAILIWRLQERGDLDVDAPVARYWPEFGQAGKADIPVRWLLTHQAGLPAIRRPLPASSQLDWEVMTAALAAQEPWWEPGTAHGYHSNTQGFLLGEVIRRATGTRIGRFLKDELREPAGIDFHFGTAPEDDRRTADMLPVTTPPDAARNPINPLQLLANRNPPMPKSGPGSQNSREYRAAEFPSTNGHGSAKALARLYGALATTGEFDGYPILGPATIREATREQAYGVDEVLGRPTRFASGFQLAMKERPLGPNLETFGHFGGGGSLGFADPEAELGFGYVMNQGRQGWQHRHTRRLIDLMYEAL